MSDNTNTHAGRTESLASRIGAAFAPRHLGIGLLWSWMTCAWIASPTAEGVDAVGGLAIFSGNAWLPSAVMVVLGLFALPSFLRKRSRLPLWAIVACALACAVGTALRMVAPAGTLAVWGLGLLTGLGSAGLLIASAGILSELETEQLEVIMPANALVSAVCSLLVSAMEPLATSIFASALPALAGVLLVVSILSDQGGAQGAGTGASCDLPHPGMAHSAEMGTCVAATLTNLAAFTAICFLESSLPTHLAERSDTWVSLVTGAASMLLIMLVIGNTVRVDAPGVYRWALPLVICALALTMLGIDALGTLAYFISEICDFSLMVLLGMYFLTLAHRGMLSGCAAAGLCYGSCQLGVLLGNLLAAGASVWQGGTQASTVGCICLLALASILLPWISGRRRAGLGVAGKADAADGEAAREKAADTGLKGIDETCSALAGSFGLSARELEVLGYLARGRTQPYIREALLLSKNTVSSHVQHVYSKLGVHSKQELIDLVESNRKG